MSRRHTPKTTHTATTTSTTADHQDVALAVEACQVALIGALQDLRRDLPTLREVYVATNLTPTRFLTGRGRAALDVLVRRERDEDRALAAANRAQPIPPQPLPKMGASPTPASAPVLDLIAQVQGDLFWIHVGARDRLGLVDAVLLATLERRRDPDSLDEQHLLAHLIDVVGRIHDLTWLTRTTTEVESLRRAVRDRVHGAAARRLHALCPWCGQRSLTLYSDAGVVRCGASYDSGNPEPCQCNGTTSPQYDDHDAARCPCKTGYHRHTWTGDKGFQRLAMLIEDADKTRAAEARDLETRKRAAAERFALAIIAGIDSDQVEE